MITERLKILLAATGLLLIAGSTSYLFASIGEPQSVWLWRDILGVM